MQKLKNIAGDFEALGLDLLDLVKIISNPKTVETEINELKKILDQALETKNKMMIKLGLKA